MIDESRFQVPYMWEITVQMGVVSDPNTRQKENKEEADSKERDGVEAI